MGPRPTVGRLEGYTMTRLFSDINRDLAAARFDAEQPDAPNGAAYVAIAFARELAALYADELPRFECAWERADNPTAGMTENDMRAFYKSHQVAADCRFGLRAGADVPADITVAWLQLAQAIEARGKETADHRATRDAIKTAVRRYLAGQGYTLPAAAVDVPKATRKATRARVACPNCGHSIAAA